MATVDVELHYEVVNGETVEMPAMGAFEVMLASRLMIFLGRFVMERRLGWMTTEMLFQLDPARKLQRRPDLAFLSYARWPREKPIPPDTNALPVVPDLPIEVVSPTDTAAAVLAKLAEYFAAGSARVWVIYPAARQVYDYASPTSVRILGWDDALDAPALLPGFSIRVADLFEDIDAPREA